MLRNKDSATFLFDSLLDYGQQIGWPISRRQAQNLVRLAPFIFRWHFMNPDQIIRNSEPGSHKRKSSD